jgi:hypothetical protein
MYDTAFDEVLAKSTFNELEVAGAVKLAFAAGLLIGEEL